MLEFLKRLFDQNCRVTYFRHLAEKAEREKELLRTELLATIVGLKNEVKRADESVTGYRNALIKNQLAVDALKLKLDAFNFGFFFHNPDVFLTIPGYPCEVESQGAVYVKDGWFQTKDDSVFYCNVTADCPEPQKDVETKPERTPVDVVLMHDNIIYDVADWFLHKESMSPQKLQLLCYYAYAWYLVNANESEPLVHRLGSHRFEAWMHGPTSRAIYDDYKKYEWTNIPQNPYELYFDDSITDILNDVWRTYGHLTMDKLRCLARNEQPWKNARGDLPRYVACTNVIQDKDIFDFYSRQADEGVGLMSEKPTEFSLPPEVMDAIRRTTGIDPKEMATMDWDEIDALIEQKIGKRLKFGYDPPRLIDMDEIEARIEKMK